MGLVGTVAGDGRVADGIGFPSGVGVGDWGHNSGLDTPSLGCWFWHLFHDARKKLPAIEFDHCSGRLGRVTIGFLDDSIAKSLPRGTRTD